MEIIHKTDISESQSLYKLLKNNLEKDLRFQFTTKGIHKDDLTFTINSFSVKKTCKNILQITCFSDVWLLALAGGGTYEVRIVYVDFKYQIASS